MRTPEAGSVMGAHAVSWSWRSQGRG